ncbi:HAD family hydrolase [Halosimplex aquaticum]|uniref:HAD family hydrolase n=1 Tax=Halosimplex aquaticum TaxID=3026162 RepID=A0ABD5XVI5_9EURY|nr:HAD family hydrolase [Halosimplex aquaticum]
MTGPVDAVLFDLDDTLCAYERSADDILAVAFERVGVDPFFDAEEYIERLGEFSEAGSGDDIRDTRRAAFGTFATEAGHDQAVGEEIADIYTDERDQTNVAFLDGAERALDALAETYRIGMVTNGDPWMQSQKLAGLGIEDRFEVIVHGGHDAPYKPDPEPFRIALEELGVEAERAVHVGNSLASDVTGAHAAGLRSVWLADGETADPEPEPHHVVESLHDLADEPWG